MTASLFGVEPPGVLEGIGEGEHGWPPCRSASCDVDDDVAEEVRMLHPGEGVADPLERIHRVDDGSQSCGLHEAQHPQGVGA